MSYPTPEAVDHKIEELTAHFTGSGNASAIGISVAVLWPTWSTMGCYVVTERYGKSGELTNHKGNPLGLDSQTPYKIASMSKTFAAALYAYAWLTAQLVDTGTRLRAALPEVTNQVLGQLLLSQMASYSSGLPKDNDGNPGTQPENLQYPYTFAAMYKFLLDPKKLLHHMVPAGTYAYSNLGFALLGAALNRVLSGPPEDSLDALTTTILRPLGMNRTHVYSRADNDTLPVAYTQYAKRAPVESDNEPAYEGAGGLVSNAQEMIIWLRANLGLIAGPLSPLLEVLQTKTVGNATLGWFWSQPTWSTAPLFSKNGAKTGFGSVMGFIPQGPSLSSAVVVLSNLQNAPVDGKEQSVAGYIFSHLIAFLNGAEPDEPLPKTDDQE